MGLAEGVTTSDESDGLLVIHGHTAESLADIAGGGQGIRVAPQSSNRREPRRHVVESRGQAKHSVAA